MCGIIGYIGYEQATPKLMLGLKHLEYRGYDSSGIAVVDGLMLNVVKRCGKIADLERAVAERGSPLVGSTGIAHTRWATHGEPSNLNAHPHLDCRKRIAVVHNGIIENYRKLGEWLRERGHRLTSETDTEVLAHLIEEHLKERGCSLLEAVRLSLRLVVGTYGLLVLSADHTGELIAAGKGSPMVIGPGTDERFVASDVIAFMETTKRRIDLEDGQIARITATGEEVSTVESAQSVTPVEEEITESLQTIERGGYAHFMLKEIFEQPDVLRDTSRGRIGPDGEVRLGGFGSRETEVVDAQNVIIVACGTSYYAGMIIEELLEGIAKIPTRTYYASEFADRPAENTHIPAGTVAFAISQSGETQDTIRAVKKLRNLGVPVFGICNAVGTKIPRLCGAGVYIHVGREIGVASTKAFTGQVLAGELISLYLAMRRGTVSHDWAQRFGTAIQNISLKVRAALETDKQIRSLASLIADRQHMLYLGRGINWPVALEGALKIKEISYIHAEGYPAAEMKHGPIALIDENMPIVAIALKKHEGYAKVCGNIHEVKARKGMVIAIAEEGDTDIGSLVDYVITVPRVSYWLSPLVTVIPLQLLAYHVACALGRNVDQPRNLAKSVVVE